MNLDALATQLVLELVAMAHQAVDIVQVKILGL